MHGLRPIRPNIPLGRRHAFRPSNLPRPRTEAYRFKKLRRKLRRKSLRRKSKNGDPLSSLFDQLPDDATDRILQLSSNKPKSPHWKGFVNPRVIVKWLKNGGGLADCIRRTFDKIEVSDVLPDNRDGIYLCGQNERVIQNFCHVVNALGSFLTDVRICHSLFPKLWENALINNCPNIKRLALMAPKPHGDICQFPLSKILPAFSGRLESLEIGWYSLGLSDIQAITMHCKGIKYVAFNCRGGIHFIEPLWRTVGPTLEELKLQSPCSYFGSNYQLLAVQKLCKKIRKLSFAYFSQRYHGQIAQLCAGLGGQLETLNLEHCNVRFGHLEVIANACSNVCVDLLEIRGCSLQAMLALGARAARVNIGQNITTLFAPLNDDRLKAVSEKCVNLVGFGVCGDVMITRTAFQALFHQPKQYLADFKCRSNSGLHADLIEVLPLK